MVKFTVWFFSKFIKFGCFFEFLNSLNFANLHFGCFSFGDCFEPVGSRNDRLYKFASIVIARKTKFFEAIANG
ncbi:hypothetical protein PF026_07925 [Campylobacter sp. CS_NA3]|nr:hypothetical protein [Campylobacter sp. CS_NA3]WBR51254.1 hypothetical protein PF026_07925 [Campylobacter sp. CS_NA3]